MRNIWDEKRIRTELARLDARTGLRGAGLPVRFGNARCTLGVFSVREDQPYFRFSNWWFQNPDWPEECALDVIRHEYAHYMDWQLYGGSGHGTTWKQCCVMIGAAPVRLYQQEREEYYRDIHRQQEEWGSLRAGDLVRHPKFDLGKIREVAGEGPNRYAVIDFGVNGIRKLNLKWIRENCVSEREGRDRDGNICGHITG